MIRSRKGLQRAPRGPILSPPGNQGETSVMSMRFIGGAAACVAAVALATSGATAQGTVAAGSVVGKITYQGRAPRPRVIRMSSDPLCMTEKGGSTSEVLLVCPGSGL